MGTPKSSTIQRWQILNILSVADNLPHRQDASRSRTGAGGSRSAIFLSPGATYHADRCEPLRQAVARGAVRLKTFARRGYPGKPLPPRMLPEISTVGFWDATGPQGWGLDWHRNEGIELTYLARGKTEFLGRARELPAGERTPDGYATVAGTPRGQSERGRLPAALADT